MSTAPDREETLRRLEARNIPDDENKPIPNEGTEQMVHQLLEANDLSSLELDPVSMKALCDMMGTYESSINDPAEQRNEERSVESKLTLNHPGGTIQPSTQAATMAVHAADLRFSNVMEKDDDVATLTAAGDATATDTATLQELQRQATMILNMQRRLDDLTIIVQNLTSQQLRKYNLQEDSLPQQIVHHEREVPLFVPPPAPAAEPLVRQPAPAGPPNMFTQWYNYVNGLIAQISASHTADIIRLFWIMHQRHVRLDGRLFFKVFFMVSILSAILISKESSTNMNESFWSASLKFNLVMLLVMVGFLIQSGYVEFLYTFFWKEGYPLRIYSGEVVDPNHLPLPAVRVAVGANDLLNPIGQDNLLGGNIEPAPPHNRGVSGLLLDVVYLIGSFFLSILPMWKPTAVLRPALVEGEHQQPGIIAAPQNMDDMAEEDNNDDQD